jgi:hypothetical protein
MKRGDFFGDALRFPVAPEPDATSNSSPGALGWRALLGGVFAVLEFVRLSSAPRILSVECLPAGNAPLPGKGSVQGQGVSLS